MESVCTALFRSIGSAFGLFDEIKREKVNTADASSGMSADIECRAGDKVVLLVEVKDRTLTLTQLEAKLDVARSRRISEILFVAERGKETAESEDIDGRIRTEFTSGQNVYVVTFVEFSRGVLILLGEKGRADFLARIGLELDDANASIAHRRTWADLLRRA